METRDDGLELRPRSVIARRAAARELRALSKGRCSGGGGSSSSSTTSSTTTNVDRRQVVAEGGVGVSSDSSTVNTRYDVQVLDGGAIAGAFDFARRVSESGERSSRELLDVGRDLFAGGERSSRELLDVGRDLFAGGERTLADVLGLGRALFDLSFSALEKDREFVTAAGVQVARAYDAAKGEGTQKFMLAVGVVAAVSVVAVVAFSGKKS